MEVKGKRVFLSGPMSGIPLNNAPVFARAHAMLKEAGARRVYDPAATWMAADEPDRGHEVYMRRCLHELTTGGAGIGNAYDLLVRLPDWSSSLGSRTEVEVAEACGIEVADLSDVGEWRDDTVTFCHDLEAHVREGDDLTLWGRDYVPAEKLASRPARRSSCLR